MKLIEPLENESAEEVWKKSLSFISKEHGFSPNREIFEEIEEISCTGKNDIEDWLEKKIKSERVIVSWQPDVAALVDAKLFITHWDDFCYPSSDDVSIWPIDEKWVIHYWHVEILCFGKSRRV